MESKMASSPSGKASDCNPLTEGSIPSEASCEFERLGDALDDLKTAVGQTPEAIAVKKAIEKFLDALTRQLNRKDLSIYNIQNLTSLKRKYTYLHRWLDGGGEPSKSEIKKFLRE